jgi:hypothetical protein
MRYRVIERRMYAVEYLTEVLELMGSQDESHAACVRLHEATIARLRQEMEELGAEVERLRAALQSIRRLPDHESQLWEHGLEREAATHSLLWDAVRLASEALKEDQ